MNITIIGSNTIDGIKLKRNIIKVANELDFKIIINLIDDNNKNQLPKLYINNNLISEGKILSEKEIVKLLKRDYNELNTMV